MSGCSTGQSLPGARSSGASTGMSGQVLVARTHPTAAASSRAAGGAAGGSLSPGHKASP